MRPGFTQFSGESNVDLTIKLDALRFIAPFVQVELGVGGALRRLAS